MSKYKSYSQWLTSSMEESAPVAFLDEASKMHPALFGSARFQAQVREWLGPKTADTPLPDRTYQLQQLAKNYSFGQGRRIIPRSLADRTYASEQRHFTGVVSDLPPHSGKSEMMLEHAKAAHQRGESVQFLACGAHLDAWAKYLGIARGAVSVPVYDEFQILGHRQRPESDEDLRTRCDALSRGEEIHATLEAKVHKDDAIDAAIEDLSQMRHTCLSYGGGAESKGRNARRARSLQLAIELLENKQFEDELDSDDVSCNDLPEPERALSGTTMAYHASNGVQLKIGLPVGLDPLGVLRHPHVPSDAIGVLTAVEDLFTGRFAHVRLYE